MKHFAPIAWSTLFFILVAIVLFPVFAHPEVPDHRPKCISNIKVNAISFLIYQEDWDNHFPFRDTWQDALQPYQKTDRYERCPKLQETKGDLEIFGYAFNLNLSGQKTPASAQTIPLVFDSINLARNSSGNIHSLPSPGRHDGHNNVAYADGSAKAIRTP